MRRDMPRNAERCWQVRWQAPHQYFEGVQTPRGAANNDEITCWHRPCPSQDAIIDGFLGFSTYTLIISHWAREDTRRKGRLFLSDFPSPTRRGKSDNGSVA